MPVKLYAWTNQHFYLPLCEITAAMCGIEVEVIIPTDEMKEDKDFQAKKGHFNYPILELEDGKILGEHRAICKYFIESSGKMDLLGKTPFQMAQVEQWGHAICLGTTTSWKAIFCNIYGFESNKESWNNAIEATSKALPDIESALAKGWFVGDAMTLADILFFRVAATWFSFVMGPEQRAQCPNLTAWYEKMYRHEVVVGIVGKYHMCAEPIMMHGSCAVVTLGAAAVVVEAKKEESDDDMDLFGSEDEDEFADRMDAKAKIQQAKDEAAGKKKKVAVTAKSNILFEVKPFDSETDLDVVAAKIFAEIIMDGLLWKTEYKKDPVAFGIYKLIIGCTVEDEKVSCDDLQEQIEAFEDLVQSVDIASFMKV